ncbi:MAG: ribonuclease III [Clostridia bacterium]|nr:ribonuclease III [Clostridia bacterium]
MSNKKKDKVQEPSGLPLPQEGLERIIGYTFNDKTLLTTALTHSSKSNEMKNKGVVTECNERLEFLGDSVLSIVVSQYIYTKYKSEQEGTLTKIRSSVVCEKALAKYADRINLGEYLHLGHGEEKNGGRHLPSITSDAFEALIAAMFLDCGQSTEKARGFILPFVIDEIEEIGRQSSFVDHKTALQQIIQQVEGEKLQYVLVGESGPDHNKTFEVEARLNSNVIGRGKGSTKREAEQNAAKEALVLFGEKKA